MHIYYNQYTLCHYNRNETNKTFSTPKIVFLYTVLVECLSRTLHMSLCAYILADYINSSHTGCIENMTKSCDSHEAPQAHKRYIFMTSLYWCNLHWKHYVKCMWQYILGWLSAMTLWANGTVTVMMRFIFSCMHMHRNWWKVSTICIMLIVLYCSCLYM